MKQTIERHFNLCVGEGVMHRSLSTYYKTRLMPLLGRISRWRRVRIESLTLVVSVAFTLFCNRSFWSEVSAVRDFSDPAGWLLLVSIGLLITGLHWLLLLILCNRWSTKPVLGIVFIMTIGVVYFMDTYRVYFDKSMIRNILETDFKEATELLSWKFLLLMLPAIPPLWILSKLKLVRPSIGKAILWRAGGIACAFAMVAVSLWPVMREMLPVLRSNKELRYLVTPSNYIVSFVRVASQDLLEERTHLPREVLDPSPRQSPHARQRKPVVLVLVVGETVRAANWGLNGYARQTTPLLAQRDVINFPSVTSSGTDTATSLPAMFSLNGRHNYNRKQIVQRESLLHLINRAGVTTLWRDNQSGDKRVNEGLPYEDMSEPGDPSLKNGDRYFDEILLNGLVEKIDAMEGDALIVLHMLGNHGPAYFQRYPASFEQWTPVCDSPDLAACEVEEVVNAYDNAILYTDYVLARAIDLIGGLQSHDAALLYVSDHGESLGEKGVYLHGLPLAIAPDTQTHVPAFLWMAPAFASSQGIDTAALRARADQPVSHDHLFHTILNLLDVESQVYDADWDLLAGSRSR